MRHFLIGLAVLTAFGAGFLLGTYHAQRVPMQPIPTVAAPPHSDDPARAHHDAALQAEIEKMRHEVCDSQELLDFQLLKMREGLAPGAIMADVDVLKAKQRARREMELAQGADGVQKQFPPRTDCYRASNGNSALR
jgi:hypothetical protein